MIKQKDSQSQPLQTRCLHYER